MHHDGARPRKSPAPRGFQPLSDYLLSISPRVRRPGPAGRPRCRGPGSLALSLLPPASPPFPPFNHHTILGAVSLEPRCDGGCSSACTRSCFLGETCCFNYFSPKTCVPDNAALDVLLAPALPGDVLLLHVAPASEWRVARGSFLAADSDVNIRAHCQTLPQICCGSEGCCVIQVRPGGSGRGTYPHSGL